MRSRLALLGLPVLAATTATVLTAADWPARPALHLALFLVAGLLWTGALAVLASGRLPRARGDGAALLAVAVALRAAAWAMPPTHSQDVYRYAWDGRVARAGINPYVHPPDAAALAGLGSGDPLFARINHRDLPTLYPPGAQLAFGLAAALPLPPVAALKLLLAVADFGLLALLWRWLRRRGEDPRWAAAWAWSPLVAIEVAGNAHLDAWPLLAMVAALWAWDVGRRTWAGLWLGLAVACKGLALPLLLGMRSRRTVLAAVLVIGATSLPYLGAGPSILGSSGEFVRRWRGNDGAFALIQWAADRTTCAALGAPPLRGRSDGRLCDRPLDLWPHERMAAAISGRADRAAVYPDEIAGLMARALVAALLLVLLAWLAVRRAPPVTVAEGFLGALLLLTPALKPWYVLWLLPLAAVSRRPAWLALAALAPLAYVPPTMGPGGAPGAEPIWTRVVEHGACWGLLAVGLFRRRWTAATVPKLDPSVAPVTIAPS